MNLIDVDFTELKNINPSTVGWIQVKGTNINYSFVQASDNESFLKFGNMLLERSMHNFNTTINENDIILTLSTCYDDYEKMVLHAKLIKRELKE